MGDVARPMLAECLAVVAERSAWAEHLSVWLRSDLARREHLYPGAWLDLDADEVCLRRRVPSKELPPGDKRDVELLGWAPWTITDPADAQEALVARGLLPEGWCGDVRRGWHERQARDDGWGDWRDVVLPAPRTVPDLVAVASLGVPAIHRTEELARASCAALREYGCPQPERVVWQVGERRRRRGQWVPIAWTAPGGSIVALSDVFSVDGFWFPEHGPEVPITSAVALWEMGLALDAIDRDAMRIVVPPAGGAR